MRKLTANYVFPIARPPLKNGIITINEDGVIVDLSEGDISDDVEFYSGIICPGFINAHCHLELSHFKNKIPAGTGLDAFVKSLQVGREKETKEHINAAIRDAEKEMKDNGIVAVGDISNSDSSFNIKAEGNLKYHTFIEVFGFDFAKADEVFARALNLKSQLPHLKSSIVPHSPYSVSEKLFRMIGEEAKASGGILSMHNQETAAEDELFLHKKGKLAEMLHYFGLDLSGWEHPKATSLQAVLPLLPDGIKLLLVHNTFTAEKDIEIAHVSGKEIFWCFCPNANLYIENRLPDIPLFIRNDARITIGTDSLASNRQLSMLEEMKTISSHFPDIPLEILLKWATKNGADFLGRDELGIIEKGKKPGLNLITNMDMQKMRFSKESRIIPISS